MFLDSLPADTKVAAVDGLEDASFAFLRDSDFFLFEALLEVLWVASVDGVSGDVIVELLFDFPELFERSCLCEDGKEGGWVRFGEEA